MCYFEVKRIAHYLKFVYTSVRESIDICILLVYGTGRLVSDVLRQHDGLIFKGQMWVKKWTFGPSDETTKPLQKNHTYSPVMQCRIPETVTAPL